MLVTTRTPSSEDTDRGGRPERRRDHRDPPGPPLEEPEHQLQRSSRTPTTLLNSESWAQRHRRLRLGAGVPILGRRPIPEVCLGNHSKSGLLQPVGRRSVATGRAWGATSLQRLIGVAAGGRTLGWWHSVTSTRVREARVQFSVNKVPVMCIESQGLSHPLRCFGRA